MWADFLDIKSQRKNSVTLIVEIEEIVKITAAHKKTGSQSLSVVVFCLFNLFFFLGLVFCLPYSLMIPKIIQE